jgi:hypothetical protein
LSLFPPDLAVTVNIDAGNIAYYRGFHIGHAWNICSVFDLAKMLIIVSVLGKLGLGISGTLKSYLLAALLQIKILVTPTIVILLFGRAVLNLVICVTAIKAGLEIGRICRIGARPNRI